MPDDRPHAINTGRTLQGGSPPANRNTGQLPVPFKRRVKHRTRRRCNVVGCQGRLTINAGAEEWPADFCRPAIIKSLRSAAQLF